MRPVPRVQITVHLEFRRPAKLFGANVAGKPIDVLVEQLVDVQGRLLLERLAAGVADEGAGLRVDVAVVVARRLGGEALAAGFARVFLDAVVVFVDVALQAAEDAEVFRADVAEKWSCTWNFLKINNKMYL